MSLPASTLPAPIASASQLTKYYGTGEAEVRALDGVDVAFAAGSFTAIMGPSGSGKSTLMHCLAGLDRPTSGLVMLGGNNISVLNDRQLTRVRRDAVGFIFQAFNLLPTLTAEQNILLPLDLAGRKPDHDLFARLVSSLRLGDRLKHLPSQLSGGQQQRVAIARALVTTPSVVFADEPTGALDSRASHDLLGYLRQTCRDLGQTIVMVTHDPNAAAFADRTVLLSDGRIVDDLDAPSAEQVMAAMAKLGA
jgi:putative ABC transport system ATP-binding protein